MTDEVKKGGKRAGAGRPAAPPRPKPVSWRPKTEQARQAYLDLGGARWLERIISESQTKNHSRS